MAKDKQLFTLLYLSIISRKIFSNKINIISVAKMHQRWELMLQIFHKRDKYETCVLFWYEKESIMFQGTPVQRPKD